MSKEYIEAFKNLKQELYYSPNQIPDIDKWHETIEQALERLEAIDNAEPSEALECLELIGGAYLLWGAETVADGFKEEISTIKQALLKAQEPKKYLKWEDLEFKHKPVFTEAKMGETIYKLVIGFDCTGKETIFLRTDNQQIVFHEKDIQFFNDLRLERVEE